MSDRPVPLRPVLWPGIAWAAAALVVLALAAGAVDQFDGLRGIPGRDALVDVLDLNVEASLGTWVTVTYAALVAVLCGLLGHVSAGEERRAWWLLGALLTVVSVDEVTAMHERLSGLVGERLGVDKVLWVIPVGLVGLALGAVLVRRMRRVRGLPWLAFVAGLGLMAAGGLGLELLSSGITGRADGWRYWLQATAEEGIELAGLALVVRAVVYSYVERAGVTLTLGRPDPVA